MLRYASLVLITSKQWNDLTERWTLLGTLHRDSLTWRPSLHLWNSLNVSDHPDWSRLSFQKEENYDTSLNSWLEPSWHSQLTVLLPDTVHPRWPQFYIFSADVSTDYYRVCDHHNVVFKHSHLLTVLSGSNLSIPLDSSRDVSDVPISLFCANIHLQCKQCTYRPSYRCQQLRRNYIKYNHTLLR